MEVEIIILVGAFLCGWFGNRIYINYKLRSVMKRIAEDNGMTLEELSESILDTPGLEERVIKVPNLFTEINENSILLYSKDTGKFMGQAKSIEELADNIYRLDKVKFALVNHDSKQFWFVEGKIKNDLKEIE